MSDQPQQICHTCKWWTDCGGGMGQCRWGGPFGEPPRESSATFAGETCELWSEQQPPRPPRFIDLWNATP